MKRAFGAIFVIFCAMGCENPADQIPPESFRVSAEDIVASSHLLVKKVIIEASGKRTVRIDDKGGNTGPVTVEAERNTDLVLAEVTFVAFLTPASESASSFWWMTQIEGSGSTASRGPSPFAVEAESLTDVLELKLEDGLHVLGQDILIGNFQEEAIVLAVM